MCYNKEVEDIYQNITADNELMYRFVMVNYELLMRRYDYAGRIGENGELYSTIELHTLTMVNDNPGITVSEIAQRWNRTKSTISVNIKKMVEKGLLYRVSGEKDAKVQQLYVTEAGKRISDNHKEFDSKYAVAVNEALIERTSKEEVENFYKVMNIYLDLLLGSKNDLKEKRKIIS